MSDPDPIEECVINVYVKLFVFSELLSPTQFVRFTTVPSRGHIRNCGILLP